MKPPEAWAGELDRLRRELESGVFAVHLEAARERGAILCRVLAACAAGDAFPVAVRAHAPGRSPSTVATWRERWRATGLAGLFDRRLLRREPQETAPPTSAKREGRRGRKAAPLVKWSGSKAPIARALAAMLPAELGTYHEPFVGGGALFFLLRERGVITRARLADLNAELVNLYLVARDAPARLIKALSRHVNTAEHFYEVRGQHPDALSPIARAARTLFLNRTCFNGLYRVNSKGLFNVPYGRQAHTTFLQPDALMGAHRALAGVEVVCEDFEACAHHVRAGDFVYFDPPYVDGLRKKTPAFSAYQAGGFDEETQRRLAALVRRLDEQGARVMLSQSDSPLIRKLYRGLRIDTLSVRRQIGGHAARRGPAQEVVVRNYR